MSHFLITTELKCSLIQFTECRRLYLEKKTPLIIHRVTIAPDSPAATMNGMSGMVERKQKCPYPAMTMKKSSLFQVSPR